MTEGAGIAHSVYRRVMGWKVGVPSRVGTRDFSLLYSVQTGSRTYLASYLMGAGASFPGGKATGA
jgi:hypothetical protein